MPILRMNADVLRNNNWRNILTSNGAPITVTCEHLKSWQSKLDSNFNTLLKEYNNHFKILGKNKDLDLAPRLKYSIHNTTKAGI